MKKILLISAALLVSATVFSQQVEYNKFYLSVGGGVVDDISENADNRDLDFQINGDGVYFFTPNFGVGLNYHYNAGSKSYIYTSPSNGDIIEVILASTPTSPYMEVINFNQDEVIHYVGCSLVGRLYLGKSGYKNTPVRRITGWSDAVSRWMIQAHIGVGPMWKKTYNRVIIVSYDLVESNNGQYEKIRPQGYTGSDITERVIGFTAAAGIHYRINSFVGVGITANGIFGKISEDTYTRLGLSAGLDIYF